MKRDHWVKHIERLDPERDSEEIQRITVAHEFPWDVNQALSFALFRTYAVPSIGRLLAGTGEFTERPQKRYDDTVLILDAVLEYGADSHEGREAVRRMNQMHRRYEISNDDYLYVLSTFVVIPKRWMDSYGWRPYTRKEIRAATNAYRELGRRMNIRDVPETFEEFERLLDDYERAHFAYDEGGRAVADSTLHLTTTFYPKPVRRLMFAASLCLMDDPLREAFRYPAPNPLLKVVVRGALKLRGRLLRLMPPRRKPFFQRQFHMVRGYPNGYRLAELGTFPAAQTGGCPVRHTAGQAEREAAAQ